MVEFGLADVIEKCSEKLFSKEFLEGCLLQARPSYTAFALGKLLKFLNILIFRRRRYGKAH
ncbi:hypothetical protein P8X34_08730 [Pyrococcus kukulkanii]|uniref:Transposase n=1 Tax=Pyrococcus kukulkanii TaxID=1609559 RepID=A0ABV4T4W6_9EURY